MTKNLNQMVKVSLLTGIAFILMLIEFPIIPIFPWLKIDLSDVPALMGAFAFGPLVGVLIEFLKVIMNVLISGTGTGGVGELANFLIGASFVAPAAFIYWRNKSKKTAVLGMILGTIFMNVIGAIANVYFLLPAYGMHMTPDQSIQYVTLGLIPFNSIKGIVVSVMTYLLYKKLSVSIFKVEPNFESKKSKNVININ